MSDMHEETIRGRTLNTLVEKISQRLQELRNEGIITFTLSEEEALGVRNSEFIVYSRKNLTKLFIINAANYTAGDGKLCSVQILPWSEDRELSDNVENICKSSGLAACQEFAPVASLVDDSPSIADELGAVKKPKHNLSGVGEGQLTLLDVDKYCDDLEVFANRVEKNQFVPA